MKREIRDKFKEKRLFLSSEDVRDTSDKIIAKLAEVDRVWKAKSIMFYYPINKEVDLIPLMKNFLKNKKVLLPRIIENELVPFVVEDFEKVVLGKYNVLEPDTYKFEEEIDVVIVPGVAFNKKGWRIGMGKGYYDKYLKDKKCVKIGVCFDFQITDKVYEEEHDIKMDLIVTENGVKD
jgi:5-formyltetrahydrofolate cyclo-ligase